MKFRELLIGWLGAWVQSTSLKIAGVLPLASTGRINPRTRRIGDIDF
nr:hypothetical protein [Sphingomonas bacterium]